jgi:ribosomal peptide maturation radical SAM protein 1
MRVLLLALPWRNLQVPAQALGTLQPWLAQHDIAADAAHLYLDVAAAYGLADYQQLDDRLHHQDMAQEACYAGLLWPERQASLSTMLTAHCGAETPWPADFWPRWQAALDQAFARTDWQACDLVVFCGNGVISSPDSHYLAGIYAAKRIKAASPTTTVALAGPDFTGDIGRSLLETVAWVDWVINGEPEQALLSACQAFAAGIPIAGPGVLCRAADGTVSLSRAPQLPSLDDLPMPDYDAYAAHPVAPALGEMRLPVEGARGCWWDRSHRDVRASCQFCSINVAWQGYRAKSVPRLVSEIAYLVGRHGTTQVALQDSISRPQDTAELYGALADRLPGLTLHRVEIYANLDRAALWQMRRAGVESVQLGVEALAPSLLARMNKGVTFGRIIEVLRDCAELGIAVTANLILGYPGSTADEVDETLRRLRAITWLPPLRAFGLMIGYGSPLARQAERADAQAVGNAGAYAALLPPEWASRLVLTHQETARAETAADWLPVKAFVQQWQDRWQRSEWAHRRFYVDEPSERPGQLDLVHGDAEGRLRVTRLHGHERRIWLSCRQGQTIERLRTAFDMVPAEWLEQRLQAWIEAGWMLAADDRYISCGLAGQPTRLAKALQAGQETKGKAPVRLTLRPNAGRPQP